MHHATVEKPSRDGRPLACDSGLATWAAYRLRMVWAARLGCDAQRTVDHGRAVARGQIAVRTASGVAWCEHARAQGASVQRLAAARRVALAWCCALYLGNEKSGFIDTRHARRCLEPVWQKFPFNLRYAHLCFNVNFMKPVCE